MTTRLRRPRGGFLEADRKRRCSRRYERYVGEGFRHHNPYFRDAQSLRAGWKRRGAVPGQATGRPACLPEGNRVAVHSRLQRGPAEPEIAVVHIFDSRMAHRRGMGHRSGGAGTDRQRERDVLTREARPQSPDTSRVHMSFQTRRPPGSIFSPHAADPRGRRGANNGCGLRGRLGVRHQLRSCRVAASRAHFSPTRSLPKPRQTRPPKHRSERTHDQCRGGIEPWTGDLDG